MRISTTLSHRVLPVLALLGLSATACGGTSEPPAPPSRGSAEPTTASSAAPAPADPEWHYEGARGPANWGTLSQSFAACGEGRAQSPVDIVTAVAGSVTRPVELRVRPAALKIAHHTHVADGINNGHTIQINYPGGDTLTLGEDAYALVQYHFHNPSEHTVDGRHSPMEMHLVHRSTSGMLAVVAVLIQEGVQNAAFEPIWSNLPKQKGQEAHYPSVDVDVDALLPSVRTSYRYDGSLTTPPCSEGVRWIVMATPIHLSPKQIGAFTALVRGNNRPTQPLHGRVVSSDMVAVR